jgi:hypothetical protein
MDEPQEMRDGRILLEQMWFDIGKRVVEKAIQIYGLNSEQAAAIKKVFLRPNDYVVEGI